MYANNTTHTSKPRGQSLVEFALLLPILLLLILGAMDFARMFTTKLVLTNAAREGANYLARHREEYPSTAKTVIAINAEGQNFSLDEIQIFCSPTDEFGCAQGGDVTVTVSKGVDLVIGSFLQTFGITGGPIILSSTVRMMVR